MTFEFSIFCCTGYFNTHSISYVHMKCSPFLCRRGITKKCSFIKKNSNDTCSNDKNNPEPTKRLLYSKNKLFIRNTGRMSIESVLFSQR